MCFKKLIISFVFLFGFNSYSWEDLIKAAENGDLETVRALIVKHYYPLMKINEYIESAEYQRFGAALISSGLLEKFNAAFTELISQGLSKDLEIVEKIGQKLRESSKEEAIAENEILPNRSDLDKARLLIFPDLHADLDTMVSRITAVFHLWDEQDIFLEEGRLDLGDEQTIMSWISREILTRIAAQKINHIYKGWRPGESLLVAEGMFSLMKNQRYVAKEVFLQRDGVCHFIAVPYKNIRTTGWDTIKAQARLGTLGKISTIRERNFGLINTAKKYLGRATGRVFMDPGGNHIPQTAFLLMQKKKSFAESNFADEDIKAILSFGLTELPNSIEEFFASGHQNPFELKELEDTYQFINEEPFVILQSDAFRKGLSRLAQNEVQGFKKLIDQAISNPGIYRHLFCVASAGNYELIRDVLIKLYYQLFMFDDDINANNNLKAFIYLLGKRDLRTHFDKDSEELLRLAIERDVLFIKSVARDMVNNTTFSFGPDKPIENLPNLFASMTISYGSAQKPRINFLSSINNNFKESLANFLYLNRLILTSRDAVILENLVDSARIDDISIETRMVLRILAAKKCADLGLSCTEGELEFIVKKLSTIMRSMPSSDGRLILQKEAGSRYYHLSHLPKRQLNFAYFGGSVSKEKFDSSNADLIAVINALLKASIENVWILLNPARIPALPAVKLDLLKNVLKENGIDSSKLGFDTSDLTLDTIFTRAVDKKENLDPFGLWLEPLPSRIYDGLGLESYRVFLQNDFIGDTKDKIARKVINVIQ